MGEKAWEVACKYLSNPMLLDSLCGTVADLSELQRLAPALKSICEQRAVEFFLVLPRLLWLGFLTKPSRGALLGMLLPEHFQDGEVVSGPLQELIVEHQRLVAQLPGTSWEKLALYVVERCTAVEESLSIGTSATMAEHAWRKAADRFLLQLEAWSMELQRHRAQDFNCCIALLLRCLELGQS